MSVDVSNETTKKASSKRKIPITEDVVNQLIFIMLNCNTIDETNGIFFNVDTLRENNAVQKYKDANMSDFLRKYLAINQCYKISPKYKDTIEEADLIVILRALLKKFNYNVSGATDARKQVKQRIYTITKNAGALNLNKTS